jgi:hypothetical protein
LFIGGLSWVTVVTLLALAISAWVRWRPAATALLFGVSVVGAGVGTAIAAMFDAPWGHLLSLAVVFRIVWSALFGIPAPQPVPLWSAWLALFALASACVLLLWRRVRPVEVVR